MNRTLVIVTPLLILALVLGTIGCEKKATPAPTAAATSTVAPTPTPPPKPSGELKIALTDLPSGSLDPFKVGNLAMVVVFALLYDYLVGADSDGLLSTETGLAQKWEHSADYLAWTFYIREGVKFHNGDDLTAEDVKFTLEQLGHPELQTTSAKDIFNNIKEIVLDGPYKVTVNLKKPSFFLDYQLSPLATKEGLIRPKKYIEANGLDYLGQRPNGTGPYRLTENVPDSHIKLEATDYHFALGVPKYKTITLYDAPEEVTRIAMLKGGQVDGIEFGRESLAGLQKEGYNIFKSRLDMPVYVTFDVHAGKSDPASDPKVREALWLAIDKQGLLDNLFAGQGELMGGRQDYPFVLGSEKLSPKPYDPERAKLLLKEAGYPERFNPTLNIYSFVRAGFPEGPAMLEAIAAYWMKIGVQVKITPVDAATYAGAHRARNLASLVAYVAYPPQKLNAASLPATMSSKGASSFFTNPPDPGMDALLDEQAAAKTADEFVAAATKIFRYDYETARSLGLFKTKRLFATNQTIKQWDLGMLGFDFLNLRNLVKR